MAHSNVGTSENHEGAFVDGGNHTVNALVAGRRLRGLSWNKTHQLWRVRIYYAGKLRFVGRFQDATTAAKAYDKAAVYLYGANAITNFGIDACLSDPSEVGSCIMRAKEEAELAANNGPAGNTHMVAIAAAAAAGGNSSNRSPNSSFSSSPNVLNLDGISAVHGANAGRPTAAVAAAAMVNQQQQEQQQSVTMLAALPPGAIPAAATINRSTIPPCAMPGVQVQSVPLHILDRMSTIPHTQLHHQHQHQQHFSTVTRALSLPTSETAASTAAITAAATAGHAGGMSSVHSPDQANYVHLLLDMQQQQQQHAFQTAHLQNTFPAAGQPLLLPQAATAVAVATTCHQLFTSRPQVFQITPGGSLAAPRAMSSAASEHAAVIELQQQQRQQNFLLQQACHYQQQQQGLDQQFQLLGLAPKQQGGCLDGGYTLTAAPSAAAAAAAATSTGLLAVSALGSGVTLTSGGGGTVGPRVIAGGLSSGGWATQF